MARRSGGARGEKHLMRPGKLARLEQSLHDKHANQTDTADEPEAVQTPDQPENTNQQPDFYSEEYWR